MKNLTIIALLSLATLACPATPGPVTPEGPPPPGVDAPALPINSVTTAFSGQEGAFAVTGEYFMDPAQPPVPFSATVQQWFGDDGVFYEVYSQPSSETSGPGMQGWGKVWADETTGEPLMSWMDTMAPGQELVMTGSVAEDGSVTLGGVGPGPDEAPTTYRSIFRFPETGRSEFEMGVVQPDGTFVVVMKYTATRTGEAVETWDPPAAGAQAPAETVPGDPSSTATEQGAAATDPAATTANP